MTVNWKIGPWLYWNWMRQLQWIGTCVRVLEFIYWSNLLKPTASSSKRRAHHGNAHLLNDSLFVCVTEDAVNDTVTRVSHLHSEPSHSKNANILTFRCPVAVARCPLQSLSADSLMPAAVTRSHSPKPKTLTILSVSSGSGSSASLRALCFRIGKRCYRMGAGNGC
jgi:hypothetical protein